MNRLLRGAAPRWMSESAVDQETRRQWYTNLRVRSRTGGLGEIHDHWNDKDERGDQPVREALRLRVADTTAEADTLTECAFCGERLGANWHVEHYLTKERFPRLAYAWANLLPSCHGCNMYRKRQWSPPSLPKDTLVDPALSLVGGERHFDPPTVLPGVKDRLIDPTFDDPAAHLTFRPECHGYVVCDVDGAPSEIGRLTHSRFFDEKSDAGTWEGISNRVRWDVEHAQTRSEFEAALSATIVLVGRSFYVRAYAQYWLDLLAPPWYA